MFRILPLTIALSCFVLVVKLIDLVNGGHALSEQFLAPRLEASKPEQHYSTASLAALNPSAGKEKDEEDSEAENDDEEGKDGEESASENDAEEGDGEAKQADGEDKAEEEKPREFSQIELDILQSLSARRQELEQWATQVSLRESMLDASELKLEKKIGEMKVLQERIELLLADYNQQENAKIRSLVKIYENMKPKDAARIFEEVDMPILLQVVDLMKEKKAAPILAKMTPQRAKELTIELAEQRKLREQGEDTIR